MGSSGGSSKKNVLTGTDKKLKKGLYHEFTRGEKSRVASEKSFLKELGPDAFSKLQKFMNHSKDPYADIQKMFGVGGEAYGQQDFANDIRQGQELARPILEGEQQKAIAQYEQEGIPQIKNALGRGSRGSSALNQALASSRQSLQESLFNRSQELGLGIGSEIAGRNQQQRQFNQGQQYDALSNILGFQGQAANQFYGLRQNAAQQLTGAGLGAGSAALNKESNAFVGKSTPFLQSAALASIEGGSRIAGHMAGKA